MPRSVVGTVQVVDLLMALRALGIGATGLCRRVGLQTSLLRDPAASVPATVVVDLLEEAERRSGDPLVGLHAGARAQPRGPLYYLIFSSPVLAEGLRQIVRFSRLAVDTLRVHLKHGPDSVRLVLEPGEVFEHSIHAIDYMLIVLTRMLRQTVGARFRMSEVHVRHPEWSDHAAAVRIFGCAARCNRSENSLVFSAGYLQAKSRGGNPLVAKQIEKFALALAARAIPPATFRQGVADATRSLVADGLRADRASVARHLRVSRRTMQRRLEDERTNFRAVRNAVLSEVTQALLANPLLKVEAVALSVGFSDVAAFCRAFKRWTGCSPTAYRQRLAATARRRKQLHLVRHCPLVARRDVASAIACRTTGGQVTMVAAAVSRP